MREAGAYKQVELDASIGVALWKSAERSSLSVAQTNFNLFHRDHAKWHLFAWCSLVVYVIPMPSSIATKRDGQLRAGAFRPFFKGLG